MFLPISDEPNPRGMPWVTYALIALNVLVFAVICWPLTMQAPAEGDPTLLEYLRVMAGETGAPARALISQVSAYDLFIFRHGFRPAQATLGDLFTSMFLHAGWVHLLGNMLFLKIFGDNVELHLGHVRYALVYLATGAAATLCFALFRLDSSVPLVGASGAISGILGCYFVWFPNNRVKVLMTLVIFLDFVYIPARWVLGFYLVVDNLLPVLFNGSDGGVAHGAHIGGFAAGAGFALAMRRLGHAAARPAWQSNWTASGTLRATQVVVSEVEALHAAIRAERTDEALRIWTRMPLREREQVDDMAWLALADQLTETRAYQPGLALLQNFVATRPRSPMLAHAHLRAGLIQLRGLGRPAAAYQHLLAVLDLPAPPAVTQAAREGLSEVEVSRQGS